MWGMKQRALIFGYPLIEVLAAWAVATWIGWGWTLLLLVAGVPVGFAVMRRAARSATAEMVAQRPPTAAHAATFIGGLLIAIPGFITDLIGAALVVPVTRRLLTAAVGPALQARLITLRVPGSGMPGAGFPGAGYPGARFSGDVIVGEVVVDEVIVHEPRPDDPDGDAPRGLQSPR